MNRDQIKEALRKHLKISGHDAWEGHYYYVDGIEPAINAILSISDPDSIGVQPAPWTCSARKQGTPGGIAPADCDWPGCGCDPVANKVLEAIDEAGFEITTKQPARGMREGLEAAIRAAKLALFVIYKQGVMPNSSWEGGFNGDLAKAEAALAASPQPSEMQPRSREAITALTKIAAECHRVKWQFDFNDENRLPVGRARDMVKRAFDELHRIGDIALKEKDVLAKPPFYGATCPTYPDCTGGCGLGCRHKIETPTSTELIKAELAGSADAVLRLREMERPAPSTCCRGLAPSWECRCERERLAQGHPPYARSSEERHCQKCGRPTKGEEAWVNGQCWCHPCADAHSNCSEASASDLEAAVGCLQSIADMKEDEPREPDDADWRWRALECKRCATVTLAALSGGLGASPPKTSLANNAPGAEGC